MPLSPALAAELDAADLRWKADAPLAKRVWWRVGGPADALVTVRTLDELVAVQRLAAAHDAPLFVLGAGSNLLVSDRGVRGLVLVLAGELADTAVQDDVLTAGAGLKNAVLLNRARKQGWAGLECLVGIPGTVGGAVVMNAGSSLGEIGERLVDATVVLRGGEVATLPHNALGLGYRTSTLPAGAVVASARLRIHGDATASAERAATFLARRKATQPLDLPSCGSTFTNPPGDHAGRLIEAAGLKGFTVGGAQVSEKHANFVVNLGGATADDVRRVIEHARDTVRERFGVVLEPEVKVAGDWETPPSWLGEH